MKTRTPLSLWMAVFLCATSVLLNDNITPLKSLLLPLFRAFLSQLKYIKLSFCEVLI